MRHIKGIKDIATHGSLDRAGRLIGVAKNLRQLRQRSSASESEWNVEYHVFKKNTANAPMQSEALERNFRNNILSYQAEYTRDLIEEMCGAVTENIPGAIRELARLQQKLVQLEAG